VTSGTAISGMRFKKESARRKKSNYRAKMALRRMGKMPMPRKKGFPHPVLEVRLPRGTPPQARSSQGGSASATSAAVLRK